MITRIIISAVVAFLVLLLLLGVALRSDEYERTQAEIARSNAQIAQAEATAHIVDSLKPDYAPIIILSIGVLLLAGTVIYNAQNTNRQLLDYIMRDNYSIPTKVQIEAVKRKGMPYYNGEIWMIIDNQGNVVSRQRLLVDKKPRT